MVYLKIFLALTAVSLAACAPTQPNSAAAEIVTLPTIHPTAPPLLTATPTPTPLNTPIHQRADTPTNQPTAPATLPPTNTPIIPTATPIGPCNERMPNDIFAIVTQTYGLSPQYEPDDIISMNDDLPYSVHLGIPMRIRKLILPVLGQMVDDMLAAGLRPLVVSGYRSHYEQSVAYNKWAIEFPDWVDNISAKPGHSEHQLGTTVDFTSPELPGFTGDPDLQFHPDFARTSEGIWLAENAHTYGFTLSYPREAYEVTGFNYEPWHFRYIGTELATRLKRLDVSFTEYQLAVEPVPCVPVDQ